MPLYVKFWGTRGSCPTPGARTKRYGGNTSCVEIRTETTTCICDAGTGIRDLGMELLERANGAPISVHLFLSHPHWDHIQGFPFFVPAYAPTTTVHVHGGERTKKVLSGQMDSEHFPVRFTDLGAKILPVDFVNEEAKAGDISVRRFAQKHPGGSSGYVFEAEGVKIAYCTDHELDELLLDKEAVKSKPAEQRKFANETLDAYRGVDLLIADAQYLDPEYAKKTGWGHPRAETVVDAAIAAGVKKLALYHHDPLQTDPDVDAKVEICAERAKRLGSDLYVFAAREGVELLFGP